MAVSFGRSGGGLGEAQDQADDRDHHRDQKADERAEQPAFGEVRFGELIGDDRGLVNLSEQKENEARGRGHPVAEGEEGFLTAVRCEPVVAVGEVDGACGQSF